MSPSSPIFYAIGNTITESLDEILLGLSFNKKMISPKYFYDELGSNLFDEITKQPGVLPDQNRNGNIPVL